MVCDGCSITVYFEDPFWVGLYERAEMSGYSVCKLTFGGEPKDYEVYQLLLTRWRELAFSPVIPMKKEKVQVANPKRVRREVRRQITGTPPVGTKAQEALKRQREEGKASGREKTRQEREAEQKRKFLLRQEKRKQKHRGR